MSDVAKVIEQRAFHEGGVCGKVLPYLRVSPYNFAAFKFRLSSEKNETRKIVSRPAVRHRRLCIVFCLGTGWPSLYQPHHGAAYVRGHAGIFPRGGRPAGISGTGAGPLAQLDRAVIEERSGARAFYRS